MSHSLQTVSSSFIGWNKRKALGAENTEKVLCEPVIPPLDQSSLLPEHKDSSPFMSRTFLEYTLLAALSLFAMISPAANSAPTEQVQAVVETAIESESPNSTNTDNKHRLNLSSPLNNTLSNYASVTTLPENWKKQEGTERTAGFALKLNSDVSALDTISVFVMPGGTVDIEALFTQANAKYQLMVSGGSAEYTLENKETNLEQKWRWKAPKQSGEYQLVVREIANAESGGLTVNDHLINAFVLVPATEVKDGLLEGYRIGSYPSKPLNNLAAYEAPKGFIRVTKENRETLVSPHFTLGQFLCKQASSYPKFVVLRTKLLLKLEKIIEAAADNGWNLDTLHLMSAYRTPHYNHTIGNVKYSRHLWGGAADIFIDQYPKDGHMDDLNKDGKSDKKDAKLLAKWVNDMRSESWYQVLLGGMGLYSANRYRGPFVHVDVRGHIARW